MHNITAIAAGGTHSLALRDDGTVWAWGYNSHGQLGTGDQSENPLPVLVTGLGPAIAIAAGDKFNLALGRDGAVWAWGANDTGQLGVETRTACRPGAYPEPCSPTPVQVPTLRNVTAIAVGAEHSLAIVGSRR